MEWTKATSLPQTTVVKVNGKVLPSHQIEVLPTKIEESTRPFKASSWFFLAPLLIFKQDMFHEGTVDLISQQDIETAFHEFEKFFHFIYQLATMFQKILWVFFGCVVIYYCILLVKNLYDSFKR